jgi:2-phosphosulfolactate phosphatase
MASLEVLFAPAEFEALKSRDLSETVCVVFDVLRATSSMVTALSNGALGVMPVASIPEALEARRRDPSVLLAGEREGVRIEAGLTGGITFELGNSPREFTPDKIAGRTIVSTTTNGTRALRACAGGRTILASSMLNLRATAEAVLKEHSERLLIVCSGTFEEAAYEDTLGAGALCDLVWAEYGNDAVADSALMARRLFLAVRDNLAGAIADAKNGRRLLARPELRNDVAFCARLDAVNLVALMGKDGIVRRA